MSLDHDNSLMEILHRGSTPASAEAMACAIRQDRAGEAVSRSLLDTELMVIACRFRRNG